MVDGRPMGEAVALTAFAVWQLVATYTDMAPSIGDLRGSLNHSTEARQKLLDADMCVGGVAIIAGSAASYLGRSWVPLALVVATLGWVSYYHHAALGGPTPGQIEGKS